MSFGATKTLAKLANHVAKTADRKPGSYPYANAGVKLLELQDDSPQQQASLDLYDKPAQMQPDGWRGLMETIDALNERFW